MPRVLHTGFGDDIRKITGKLANTDFQDAEISGFTNYELQKADVVLLGPHTDNVLKAVQIISRQDGLISTLVFADEEHYSTIKQSLMFTPFVSRSAQLLRVSEKITEEITKAALLTKQRRNFARVTVGYGKTYEKKKAGDRERSVRVEELGAFLDQAPIGAIIINAEQKVAAINLYARKLFNVSPLQPVTRLSDILDTASVDEIRQYIGKRPAARFIEVLSRNQYLEIHFAEIVNEEAEKLQILLITDVTDRKLEMQRIRAVLDSLPQMAWTTNANGDVTYFTKGWYDFTGQTFSQAMGDGWRDVIHPDDRERFVSSWEEALNSKKQFEGEARYRRSDGQYRWHLVRGVPLLAASGNAGFWLGTCTDIEDQKKHQHDLSEEVRKQTQELTKVNDLLKRSNNDLKEFAYVASHDLKEPIRKIRIFLERAQAAKDEPARLELLNKVAGAAVRMTSLIDGIMAYSQVSGGFRMEKVDLNEIVALVLNDLDEIIREKKAQVRVSQLPVVSGIRTQLGQLFTNLISNSLKYNDATPVIDISAETSGAAPQSAVPGSSSKFLKIIISDNGIGFDEKYAREIFVMFRRLHNRDEYSGAGIGLALVKKIVDNHNGFIEVESKPGKGTSFLIYLPLD